MSLKNYTTKVPLHIFLLIITRHEIGATLAKVTLVDDGTVIFCSAELNTQGKKDAWDVVKLFIQVSKESIPLKKICHH